MSATHVPVRLHPDGRVVARVLHGAPRPWVAVHGGGEGVYLDVETYTDRQAADWQRLAAEPIEPLDVGPRRRPMPTLAAWRRAHDRRRRLR